MHQLSGSSEARSNRHPTIALGSPLDSDGTADEDRASRGPGNADDDSARIPIALSDEPGRPGVPAGAGGGGGALEGSGGVRDGVVSPSGGEMKRVITPLYLTASGVGSTIGAGIFVVTVRACLCEDECRSDDAG